MAKNIVVSRADFKIDIIGDENPDVSYLEQEGFEERLAAYRNGDFGFIGIRASVQISIPHGKCFILQSFESPGLWGIESDSDNDYLKSVGEEEKDVLADMLGAMANIRLAA